MTNKSFLFVLHLKWHHFVTSSYYCILTFQLRMRLKVIYNIIGAEHKMQHDVSDFPGI